MICTDEQLVTAAAAVAENESRGLPVSPATVSLLKAIAATRDEAKRRELARQAAARAGHLTDAALQVLRVAIFALA